MVPYFNFISNTVMALGHSGKKKCSYCWNSETKKDKKMDESK